MNLESNVDLSIPTATSKIQKVLLVEDDPHWQLIIGRTLKAVNKGINLRCVRNAKHAEQILYNNPTYDLIIADHFLDGEITGLDFWRQCQASYSRIPFMMVSGLGESEFLDLVDNESNCPLYLSKTFEIGKLKTALDRQLRLPFAKKPSIEFYESLKKAAILGTLTAAMLIPPILQVSDEIKFQHISNSTPTIPNVGQTYKASPFVLSPPPEPKIIKAEEKLVPRKFNVNQIITPDLKRRINRIVARADEINKLSERILLKKK